MEVWNPGELPPELTPQLLREPHGPMPRNPLIAEPLYRVQYVEKAGTGTTDMIADSQKVGLPEPDFEMTREKQDYRGSKAGWTLLEFTPRDIKRDGENAFRKVLKALLEDLGVDCYPLSEDEIWHRLRDRAIGRFTRVVVGFIISTNYRSCAGIVEIGNALMDGIGKPARPWKSTPGTVLVVDLNLFKPTTREIEQHPGDMLTPAILRLAGPTLIEGHNSTLLSRKNSLPWYVNLGEKKSMSSGWLERFLEGVRSFLPKHLRKQIDISTVHKFKGLQESTVIILDAVGRSYPLIHPDWVFTRALGDHVEKIIDEEKRLFYVALTRAVNTLIVLSESGNFSPFLESLLEKIPISTLEWAQYPPLKELQSRVTVKVGNREGEGVGPAFKIKDQLKAEGYQWTSTGWKSWRRTYAAEGFSVKGLYESSTWMSAANGIEVRVYDDYDALVERCWVHDGRYRSVMDKPK